MWRKGHISPESWQAKQDTLPALLKDPIVEEWREQGVGDENLVRVGGDPEPEARLEKLEDRRRRPGLRSARDGASVTAPEPAR